MDNSVTSSINCADYSSVDYDTTLLKPFIANNPPYHHKQSSSQAKQPRDEFVCNFFFPRVSLVTPADDLELFILKRKNYYGEADAVKYIYFTTSKKRKRDKF